MPDTCSRLEAIGNQTRADLLVKNIYQDNSGLKYSAQHPNATQAPGGPDDPFNDKGKEPVNGGPFDTSNGGSSVDINGIPGLGGGRNQIYIDNQYTPNAKYDCFMF